MHFFSSTTSETLVVVVLCSIAKQFLKDSSVAEVLFLFLSVTYASETVCERRRVLNKLSRLVRENISYSYGNNNVCDTFFGVAPSL
jgi:hypothetical protein